MSLIKKMIFYVIWLMVGIITPYAGMLILVGIVLLGEIDFWSDWGVGVLTIVPFILLIAMNGYNKLLTAKQKEIPHYYAKTILCVALGAILNSILMHLLNNTLDTIFMIYFSVGNSCMLASMSVIQYFYLRLEKRKSYLKSILVGAITAYIIGIIICLNYDRIGDWGNLIITFIMLAVAIFIIMQERKFCNQISEKQSISQSDYVKNVIRITLLTITLLIPSFVWMCGTMVY